MSGREKETPAWRQGSATSDDIEGTALHAGRNFLVHPRLVVCVYVKRQANVLVAHPCLRDRWMRSATGAARVMAECYLSPGRGNGSSPSDLGRQRGDDVGMPIPLMLATLTDRRDVGDDWLLERKLDGERCVATRHGADVRLESRTGKDLTGTYPEVRAALAAQRVRDLVLDGEVVAYDGGQTSFSRLQQRLGVTNPSPEHIAAYPVVYCVFDILEVDGEDLADRPLLERRARLAGAIRPSPAVQLTEAWRGDSQARFAEACRAGWEGLIAKRADAPYTPGRSKDWLKLKCAWEQEFVVGGYTDPAGSRTDFGALLVGYYEGGLLRYAGKVGTGYTAATLRDLGARLHELETPESPFVDVRPIPRGTHWTKPELVAQIGFAEWTNDGRLRQPRFLGLRDDKRPAEVVRERPA
jgi:DNA ligase D-like protein (predicted ligase)